MKRIIQDPALVTCLALIIAFIIFAINGANHASLPTSR